MRRATALATSLAVLFALATVRPAQQLHSPLSDAGGQLDGEVYRALGLRCGLPPRGGRVASQAPSDCGSSTTNVRARYAPQNGATYHVPIVFHVIESTGGLGRVSDAAIRGQVRVLNEDYRALSGTPGGLGFDTRIEFHLARQDPLGRPTSGILRHVNDEWFADRGEYWKSIAWDPSRYLNVYTNTASGWLGYVPNVPQGGIAGAPEDRVVLFWGAVGRNAPIGPPYDQGRSLTHEIGHYLGLDHTFSGGCVPATGCYTNGDLICDTNPQLTPTFGCPSSSASCGSSDPFRNYMDYADDSCMARFTAEQANRMRCTLEEWRSSLYQTLCGARGSVSSRVQGTNPAVLSAEQPAAGEVLELRVATWPWRAATVVAHARKRTRRLPGGRYLLLDTSSAKLFQLGPLAGRSAAVALPVPLDPTLCGARFHVQAFLEGGPRPWALSNALEIRIGD